MNLSKKVGIVMWKKISFTIMLFLIMTTVSAKEPLLTCVYSHKPNDYEDNNIWLVGMRCTIYDNYSNLCYMDIRTEDPGSSGNRENILNWVTPTSNKFVAMDYVQKEKKCLPYLTYVAVAGFDGYRIYGADSLEMAQKMAKEFGTDYAVATLRSEFKSETLNPPVEKPEDEDKDKIEMPDISVTDTDIKNFCSSPSYRKPMKFLGTILNFVKAIVPIVIIIFGMVDLYKGITASKEDVLKKSVRTLAIRVMAGVFIFFLPGLIQFVLSMVNEWSNYKNTWCCCTDCLLNSDCDTSSCNSDTCRIERTN